MHWRLAASRLYCILAGDALPVWLVMALLTLPDGIRRRGVKVLYDMATGKFMVRGVVLTLLWTSCAHEHMQAACSAHQRPTAC